MKTLNHILDHAMRDAVSILKDRNRTRLLLEKAMKTLLRRPGAIEVKGLAGKMQAASRMVRLSVRREYRELPWQSLMLITAGFVYFVTPVDSIPDFIPMLGFVDDAAILTAIFTSISSDLDRFIEWERSSPEATPETRKPDSSGEN
jgi:uncharacterized membrane protein YkvA (DUF1232 family)